MGWFNKKEKNEEKPDASQNTAPPRLPRLPELPKLESHKEQLHKLPSFPNSSIGKKFSQDTIKEAVKGFPKKQQNSYAFPEGKRGGRVFEADDFKPIKKQVQMMPKPKKLVKKEFEFPKTEEIEEEFEESPFDIEEKEFDEEDPEPIEQDIDLEPKEMEFEPTPRGKKSEPVFIRIDKFEASLKTFNKTKKEVAEIERLLKDISKVKEEEEKQLESWQNDIIKVKEQIDKVDEDIFSRLE